MSVPPQPGLEASIGSLNPSDHTPPNGAQSPNPSPAAFAHGATGELQFTADQMAKARKEEKDKLYPEITALKEQWSQAQKTLDELKNQRQQELDEVVRKQQEREAALTAKKEEEMSAKALLEQKLQETTRSFEEQINKINNEREQERALSAKERAYNELVAYRSAAIEAAGPTIAPQFYDFIAGESQEQIDTAIARAQQSTQSIIDEVKKSQQTSPPRGVSATGYTVSGPLDNLTGTKQYSLEDINSMTMKEYEEFRQKSGMASSDANRNRGLFS